MGNISQEEANEKKRGGKVTVATRWENSDR